jgi:hypothetical protein
MTLRARTHGANSRGCNPTFVIPSQSSIVDRSVIVLGTTPGVFVVRTDGEGERTFAYLTASLAMRSYDIVDRHRWTPFGAARVCGRGADGQD